jgi:branched-subunit amino acid ABC-type transport system permease component
MVESLVYGLTLGAILYLFSIGLSLTFGTMKIINFAHAMAYTLGVYFFITFLRMIPGAFIISTLLSAICMIPVAYLLERFVIRRLYGESLDYAIIATYAVLLIGTDFITFVWGNVPQQVRDPVGLAITMFDFVIPVYRLIIIAVAVILFFVLNILLRTTITGKIIIAALEDVDGVRCLGVNVNKHFSIVFIFGSILAVLGGILYAPISAAEPYMWLSILLIAFAVVILGGMGNLNGTFVSAFILGIIMAITGRFYSAAADTVVFVVMAIVLIFRRRVV